MSQFPPSSPVIHDDNDHDDGQQNTPIHHKGYLSSFHNTKQSMSNNHNNVHDYPTPLPSSSANYTSPLRDISNTANNANINANLQPSSPIKRTNNNNSNTLNLSSPSIFTKDVSQTPIPTSPIQRKVYKSMIKNINLNLLSSFNLSIGRSSLTNAISLNKHNKLISRNHLIINYDIKNDESHDSSMLEIKCVGYNGFNIIIPSLINVKKSSKDKEYLILIKDKSNKLSNDSIINEEEKSLNNRIINESNISNFYILKDESILLNPSKLLKRNLLIDIKGEILLLKLTNDENQPTTGINDKTTITTVRETTPSPSSSNIPTNQLKTPLNSIDSNRMNQLNNPSNDIKTPATVLSTPNQTPIKQKKKIHSNDNSPIIHSHNTSLHKKQKIEAVSNTENKDEQVTDQDNDSSSTSLQSLNNLSIEQINKIISLIPNKEELSHILINHLAFSRILQTPFNTIIQLNPVKSLLKMGNSCQTLKLFLNYSKECECIGVITRKGKDAAGKPLDEEYYYIPELDHDQNRVQLVKDLKGIANIRSCRKTHKQYFWKKPGKPSK